MNETNERIFFNEGDVTVTNLRFITSQETFAMSGVTSVSKLREDPKSGGMFVLCFACIFVFALVTNWTIRLAAVGVGIAAFVEAAKQKPTFFIVIKTASGESRARSQARAANLSIASSEPSTKPSSTAADLIGVK